MSAEHPFKKVEDIDNPEFIVTDFLEQNADDYFNAENPDLALTLYQLPTMNGVARYQVLKSSREDRRQIIGPSEDIVAEIKDHTLSALLREYPEFTWETAFSYGREESGGFLIYLDLNKLQKLER